MRFLADESCDFRVIRALRAAGHDVVAVAEVAADGRPLSFAGALKRERQTACILASRRSLIDPSERSPAARERSSDIRHRQRPQRMAVIDKWTCEFFEER